MRALRLHTRHDASVVSNVDLPALRPDQLLVKTHAVALNPTDWEDLEEAEKDNLQLGCDFAGEVVEVGSAVTKPWRKGDRVFGVVHGGNNNRPEDGSYAEYILAPGDLAMRIPDRMSYEEATTLGMGICTVGQGKYQELGMPWPNNPIKENIQVLVYGGSSTMGSYAIQFGKA
jgi:NADPH:quinone reductase-like Zn-dependent oxidoreductase